ncbi:MAG TPA: DUF3857 and transglutaminase domain-containing protein [Pyrinomonadaceae bacterium]|nr:DUF3857 and transglutaminase domain-containing protein [Pyrinomonadaceae bacterium]
MYLLTLGRISLSIFSIFVAVAAAAAQDKGWLPIPPIELQRSAPVVEPDADAEALLWEVRVDDSRFDEMGLKHYVRIKIFTERGREDFARHDVAFTKGTRIKDFEARVTKPDGSVSYVSKDEVMERDIVRANGFKVRAKTIAFPGLEIGSIVEYRYKEVISDAEANMRLIFQREIPVREISYYIKPFSGTRALAYHPFNVRRDFQFEKTKDGFHRATMRNVQAFREEPFMLPEDEVKSWVYIYYTTSVARNPDEYWRQVSSSMFEFQKEALRANDEVKRETTRVIQGAEDDDEKLKRIYDFVKSHIKNVNYADQTTEEQRRQASRNKNAADTLKYRVGTAGDVDQLFGAMARAAGFDARIAFSGNRNDLFFDRNIMNLRLALGSTSIAVNMGNDWRFFSPASYFVPFGMMSWVEEDQVALVPDPKNLLWKNIPLSEAGVSKEKRSGKFKLLDDGTLVGEARVEFLGHQAYRHKMLNRGESDSAREDRLKNFVRSSISSSVEFENFTIENVNDPEKPLIYTFKIKAPGYGQRTGRRLFFNPNVFERNSQPKFTANTRKYDIYISYPYSEDDDITIEFPEGYALENAEMPGRIRDQQGIGSHEAMTYVLNDGKAIRYSRQFSFGNGGNIRYPVEAYNAVKALFDAFNKADVHQLTLRAN